MREIIAAAQNGAVMKAEETMETEESKKSMADGMESFIEKNRDFFAKMAEYCGKNGMCDCSAMFNAAGIKEQKTTTSNGGMKMKDVHKTRSGKGLTTVFGIIIAAVGIAWLGESLGIVPAGFDPLKYAIPVSFVVIGAWMVTGQFLKRFSDRKQ